MRKLRLRTSSDAQGSQLEGAGAGFEPRSPSPLSHHRAALPLLSEEPGLGRPYTREATSVITEAAGLAEMEGKRKGSSSPALPSYPIIRLEFPADQQRREARGGAVASGLPAASCEPPGRAAGLHHSGPSTHVLPGSPPATTVSRAACPPRALAQGWNPDLTGWDP